MTPTDPSLVKIQCPKLTCQRILAVPTIARGKTVRCRNCGTLIKVPGGPEQTGRPSAKAGSAPA